MTNLANTDVAILAGGLGTRLRKVIGETQKTMAKVAGEPFLNLILEYLKNHGFQRVILCTGYQADQVEEYYRDNDMGLQIEFSREDVPMDTGGAIKNARAFIHSDPFIVLNGDSFCPIDYSAFLQFHRQEKAIATLAVSRVKDSKDFGTILLNERKRIVGFQEKLLWKKSPQGFVSAGVYCFNHSILSLMPPATIFSFEKDLFPSLPERIGNDFCGFLVEEEFLDIGNSVRYQSAQEQNWKDK